MIVKWDSRNGAASYPYQNNGTWAYPKCPKCQETLEVLDMDCDYVPHRVRCKCGAIAELPGIEDAARFSGLRQRAIDEGYRRPIEPGEVPVNASELVKEIFASFDEWDC